MVKIVKRVKRNMASYTITKSKRNSDLGVPEVVSESVFAAPMNSSEYFRLMGWRVQDSERPYEGYIVKHPSLKEINHPLFDCHVSWFPKFIFDRDAVRDINFKKKRWFW